jgi:two-component system, sensor histidine kinase LadS
MLSFDSVHFPLIYPLRVGVLRGALQKLYQPCLNRALALCLCVAWLILAAPTFAQSSPPTLQDHRVADTYPALEIKQLAILTNTDPNWGIEQVSALPSSAFKEISLGQAIQDPSWDRSLWVKLVLHAKAEKPGYTPSASSVLEIQKPYLDRVTLYSPIPGGWEVQRAGDAISGEIWSLPGQFPRFGLPTLQELQASGQAQMVLYMHVPHRLPANFQMQLWSEVELMANIQQDFILLGMTFGAMALAVFLSLALLAFHRDRLFLWYAGYALAALLACVSHSGLGFQYFWPYGGLWPSTAVVSFMLIAAAAQLQFSKLLFTSSSLQRWPVKICEALGLANVVVALIFPWVSLENWTHVLFVAEALVVVSMLAVVGLLAASWRLGNKLAMAMVFTYAPLFVTVIMVIMDAQGLIGVGELGYNAPIYAVSLEITLLGLCLQWFGHERHGKIERERALASTDPLTGFSTAAGFAQHLQDAWVKAKAYDQDMSVAYIQALGDNDSPVLTPHKLKRCVRLLRTVTRETDVVSRLDDRTLAILLPGMGMGEDLSARLARLIALGLIPDRQDPVDLILRFRIVATSFKRFDKKLRHVDGDLRNILRLAEPWKRKSIQFIPRRGPSTRADFANSDDMNAMWNHALDAEHTDQQAASDARSTQPTEALQR